MNILMKRLTITLLFTTLLLAPTLSGKYKIKPIEVKKAAQYPVHIDFQQVVIGAQVYDTEEEILELFDAKKMFQKGIMPVLLVVENNNSFALEMDGEDVYLVTRDGTNVPPIPPIEVMLELVLKKPLDSYSTRKEIMLMQAVPPNMRMDFEHKSFGEKLIAPLGSDYGVVFFPLLEDVELRGARLYLPEIRNMTDDNLLMFFEFPIVTGTPD